MVIDLGLTLSSGFSGATRRTNGEAPLGSSKLRSSIPARRPSGHAGNEFATSYVCCHARHTSTNIKENPMITSFHRSVVMAITMRSCVKLLQKWQRALAMLIGGAIALNAAHAAAPQVNTQAPGYYRMLLGDFEVTVLSDGTLSLPASVMTNTTEAETEKALARNFQRSPFDASDNAFLINTGAKLVLIDTGCGNLMGPSTGNLLMNLKAAGYRPEQIDEVYLTHMHPDHAGGLMVEGKLAFPNAVLRANQRDADFWLNEANLEKSPAAMKDFFKGAMASVNPYIAAGKFEPFQGNTQLVPGIEVIAAPGHTPGHSIYSIESRGQKMLL